MIENNSDYTYDDVAKALDRLVIDKWRDTQKGYPLTRLGAELGKHFDYKRFVPNLKDIVGRQGSSVRLYKHPDKDGTDIAAPAEVLVNSDEAIRNLFPESASPPNLLIFEKAFWLLFRTKSGTEPAYIGMYDGDPIGYRHFEVRVGQPPEIAGLRWFHVDPKFLPSDADGVAGPSAGVVRNRIEAFLEEVGLDRSIFLDKRRSGEDLQKTRESVAEHRGPSPMSAERGMRRTEAPLSADLEKVQALAKGLSIFERADLARISIPADLFHDVIKRL